MSRRISVVPRIQQHIQTILSGEKYKWARLEAHTNNSILCPSRNEYWIHQNKVAYDRI